MSVWPFNGGAADVEPSEHERESLEAHVDACHVRYRGIVSQMLGIKRLLYVMCGLMLINTAKSDETLRVIKAIFGVDGS